MILANLKTNNTIFKDYREAYDNEGIKLVQTLYKEDLDNFEYEFD